MEEKETQEGAGSPENPQAFPLGGQSFGVHLGMTLHDYVAVSVLQGLMANPDRYKHFVHEMAEGMADDEIFAFSAESAFRIADAFLAERAKRVTA